MASKVIKKLESKDQAYAFYIFQLKERYRHLEDITNIDKDLKKLEKDYGFKKPNINLDFYVEV